MTPDRLSLVVPGPLDQRTGGYLYDARMARRLRDAGWEVAVHELEGRFPDPDARARRALDEALGACRDGARVLVDGLALGGLPSVAARHGPRLGLLALVHHPLSEETGLSPEAALRLRRSEAAALAACRGVVVTSAYTAGRVEEMGVPSSRIRTAVPGTEPAPDARGPGPGEPPRLLCVASVTPRKGHDVLVRALAELRDLPWRCDCVGSLDRAPDHTRAVRDAARECGLDDRVGFTGELGPAEVGEWYAGASLFVLPSHYEGYGMVLTEALARGLPVVSTTGGAVPHTVPDDAGVLVPPGDAGALAVALRALLDPEDGPRRRARLAEAARRHADALPGWDEAAATFADALRSLVPDEAVVRP